MTYTERHRQASSEVNAPPIANRRTLSIVRRFGGAARNVGLPDDISAAGVKSPRVRQANEAFK
ncbi:MAG: hypothetical protein ABSC08_07385 [Bryobacteraceae bacterium]